MEELKKRLDGNCIDFSLPREEEWQEQIAMAEEELLEQYLEEGNVDERQIPRLIQERKIFPCFFGSALKMTGVEEFIQGIRENVVYPVYPEGFGAKVYKIGRDNQNARLTYMKITGGESEGKNNAFQSGRTPAGNGERGEKLGRKSGSDPDIFRGKI